MTRPGIGILNASVRNGKASALFFYLLLSFVLTVLNKLLLQKVKAPYLLTAFHALASWIGSRFLTSTSKREGRTENLQLVDHLKLILFSILYCLNIGISNLSLQLTPLPLHQVLRATTPAITASFLRISVPNTRYSLAAYTSLALIVLGVILATGPTPTNDATSNLSSDSGPFQWSWSSYAAPRSAVLLTLIGAILASLKSITASILQKPKYSSALAAAQNPRMKGGLGLSAPEMIVYISPLALVQSLLYASAAGELEQLLQFSLGESGLGFTLPFGARVGPDPGPVNFNPFDVLTYLNLLLLNCATAFALNVASFEANRRCGALGMTIAGNTKQVLIVALGVLWSGPGQQQDRGRLGWARGIGIMATVMGSYWSAAEARERGSKRKQQERSRADELEIGKM